MPQIPTLPIDEPVALQRAKPGIFGGAGEAVAELGYQTEQMAQANMAFEGHLIEAQRYLKYKQVEIDVGKLENQAHEALSKTSTPEEAQAVHVQFKQEVDNVLGPHMSDKALARQLHIYGQQVDVEMQNTVNARKATIIHRNDEAANKVLYNSSLQEAINIAGVGGDSKVARDKLESKLQASVHMGTLYPDQVEALLQRFDKDVDKGVIKAKYNSPDAATRNAIIKQLRSGEGFPHLDEADINALLTAAEKRDRELAGIYESENYNAAVNHFDELTQGFTYEGKVGVLKSGPWLKANGFVDEHGEPDRKMAKVLLEDADRQETRDRKIQSDRDNDIISKYLDAADTGKLSVPQIDKMVRDEGGSPKAASTLKSALHQHTTEARAAYRFGEYVRGAGERTQRRDARKEGEKASAELFRKLTTDEPIDISDVWDKVDAGEMTVTQARKVESAFKKHQREDFTRNIRKLSGAPGMTQDKFNQLSSDLTTAVDQQNLEGKAVDDYTDKLLQEHGKQATGGAIQRLWNALGDIGSHVPGAPSVPVITTPMPAPSKAPVGATMKVPDKNGKMHWSNDKHEDLGLVEP